MLFCGAGCSAAAIVAATDLENATCMSDDEIPNSRQLRPSQLEATSAATVTRNTALSTACTDRCFMLPHAALQHTAAAACRCAAVVKANRTWQLLRCALSIRSTDAHERICDVHSVAVPKNTDIQSRVASWIMGKWSLLGSARSLLKSARKKGCDELRVSAEMILAGVQVMRARLGPSARMGGLKNV